MLQVLSELRQVAVDELEIHCFDFADEAAMSHLFGVASGLYSLVPGEPQIQGQVAEALEIAQGGGYAGPVLSALFRAALVTGKRARSEAASSTNYHGRHLTRARFAPGQPSPRRAARRSALDSSDL